MSRNIPPCRTWRVRWHDGHGKIFHEQTVITVNKEFAKWLTRNSNAWFASNVAAPIRVTVSLVRKPNMCR